MQIQSTTPFSSIIISTTDEDKKKKQLQRAIARKRSILVRLTAKYEMLKMDLDTIKREYDVRIGRLYLKDNHLDLEIIRYRTIQKLMSEGRTYDQAVLESESKYGHEESAYQAAYEAIDEEELIFKKEHDVDASLLAPIKNLWKKLITKYHPDLTTDKEEKIRRTEIMKQINNAYAEKDLEQLQVLERDLLALHPHASSVPVLEDTLVYIENKIIEMTVMLQELKSSEWFGWKRGFEKAKRKGEDIFKSMERELLDIIVKKIEVLNGLREAVKNT